MSRASLSLVLLALGLLGAGCGSGSDDSTAVGRGLPAEAKLIGAQPAERKIAKEVQSYLERNCATPGAIDKLPAREKDDPRNAPFIRDLEGDEEMCGHLASIAVEGTRVTIRSDIDPAMKKAAGEAFCLLIWGSDVADSTPGHELQALDGTTIKRCPASP